MLTSLAFIGVIAVADANEILASAKRACEVIQTATYRAKRTGLGADAGRLGAESTVVLKRVIGQYLNVHVAADTKSSVYDRDQPYHTSVQFDGERLIHTDFVEKIQRSGDPKYRFDRMILLDPYTTAFIAELVNPGLFDTAMSLDPELIGETFVDGIKCDYVRYKSYPGAPEGSVSYLAIGKKDHLPRRKDIWSSTNRGVGVQSTEILGLVINQPVDESRFIPKTLEGFRQEKLGLIVGTPAPALELEGKDGTRFSLAEKRGRVVLLDFWASWCAPCLASIPSMSKMQEEYRDKGLDVIGVNVMEKSANNDAAKLFRDRGGKYATFSGSDKTVEDFRIHGLPLVVIVSKSGQIAAVEIGSGPQAEERIREIVVRELARS